MFDERKKGPVAPALVLVAFLAAASAQSARAQGGSVALSFANDTFVKTDGQYTNGLGLTWISSDFTSRRRAPIWGRPFFYLLTRAGSPGIGRNVSVTLWQGVYTPDNIRTAEAIPNDHPYAGLAFASFGFHQKQEGVLSTLRIDAGIVGPHSGAERLQTELHEWIGSPAPEGWANQIRDEVILNIDYRRLWRLRTDRARRGFGADLLPDMTLRFGNRETSAGAGVETRFGWRLPDNYGSDLLPVESDGERPPAKSEGKPAFFGVHLFAALRGELVGRDIVLDGNTFGKSPRVHKNIARAMGTLGAGAKVGLLRITASFDYNTKRFDTQATPHMYGSLTLAVAP